MFSSYVFHPVSYLKVTRPPSDGFIQTLNHPLHWHCAESLSNRYLLFSSRACRAEPFLRFHSGWTCNQRRRPGTPGWSGTMETEEGTLRRSSWQSFCHAFRWSRYEGNVSGSCWGTSALAVTNLTLVPAGCRSACSGRGSTRLHRPGTLLPSWTRSEPSRTDRTERLWGSTEKRSDTEDAY